jgi:stage II sporulation protein D
MLRPIAIVLILCGSSAAVVAWASEDSRVRPFEPLIPLSMEELYAKRLRFRAGEPIVSVGVVEGQSRLALQADGPIRLIFEEYGIPKTAYAPSGASFVFRIRKSQPARLRYWAIVDSVPYRDREAAGKKQEAWSKQLDMPVKMLEVGALFATSGNVLDTRKQLIGAGGFARESDAHRLMNRLSLQRGIRSYVETELVELPSGEISIYDEVGHLRHVAKDAVYFGTTEDGQVELVQGSHESLGGTRRVENRKYWGHMYIVVDRTGRLAAVNSVGVERLLAGVVPAEIFADAPIEALKAQAVTARGAVFAKLGHKNFGDPFHICATQQCQVYGGAGYERPKTNQAVVDTRGLLAVRPRDEKRANLTLVDSVYSASNGGFAESNDVVWDERPSPSLRARIDGSKEDPALQPFAKGLDESNIRDWLFSYPPTYTARSSYNRGELYRWQRNLSAEQIDEIATKQGLGRLKNVIILGRGKGGRVTGVRLVGTQGEKDVLRELPVRRLFGNLKSGMFVLDVERRKDGTLSQLRFSGGGWGHGVGMSQLGAIGRAEHKQNFREILAHYYNNAVVERLY